MKRKTILATLLVGLFAAAGMFVMLAAERVAPPVVPDLSGASSRALAAIQHEAEQALAQPDSAILRGQFGMVLLAHQYDSAAALEFAAAALLAPDEFRWPYLQGIAEISRSRSAAANCFRAAAELNSRAWQPKLRLAELLLADNHPEQAAPLIAAARTIAPDELRPALAEIRLLLLEQNFTAADDAIKILRNRGILVRELVELDAQCQFRLNHTAAATAAARTLEDEQLPAAGWNDPWAAATLAYSTDPADTISQARSLAASGNLPEAAGMLSAAQYLAENHPDYFPVLTRILLEAGRPAQALQAVDQGLAKLPRSPQLLHLKGSTLQVLNRIPEAIDSYKSALSLKPDLTNSGYNLALCLQQSSDPDAAVTTLRQVLAAAPEMHAARILLAQIFLDQKNPAAAAPHIKILADTLLPTNPQLQQLQKQLAEAGFSQN